MSENIAALFVGFMLACTLIVVCGLSPKQINTDWEKKLIQKGLGEYVVENIEDEPVIIFKFKN